MHKITLISEHRYSDDDIVVSSVSYEKPCDDMGGAAVEDWLLTQGMCGIGYIVETDDA